MTETEAAARELCDVPAYKAAASLNYVIQNLSDEIAWKDKHPRVRVHVDFLRDMRRAATEAGEAYTAILADQAALVAQLVEALCEVIAEFHHMQHTQRYSWEECAVLPCVKVRPILNAEKE